MAETLTLILTDITAFINAAFGWVTESTELITSEPLIFIFVVAVPLVGLGIGLLKRLITV